MVLQELADDGVIPSGEASEDGDDEEEQVDEEIEIDPHQQAPPQSKATKKQMKYLTCQYDDMSIPLKNPTQ